MLGKKPKKMPKNSSALLLLKKCLKNGRALVADFSIEKVSYFASNLLLEKKI